MKIPNTQKVKSSKIASWLHNFCNKSWVAKTIVTILIWIVALIPFDLYLLIRWGIGPETFWEEIALMLVAVIVVGWLQGLLIFFGIALTLVVILEGV